jgi:hypothetical protein
VVDRAVAIVFALVGTPRVLSRRRHAQIGDGVEREIPEPHAAAILSRRRGADDRERNRSKQWRAHVKTHEMSDAV